MGRVHLSPSSNPLLPVHGGEVEGESGKGDGVGGGGLAVLLKLSL